MEATDIHFIFIEYLQCLVLRCTQSMQVLLFKNGQTDEDADAGVCVCVCVCVCLLKDMPEKEL